MKSPSISANSARDALMNAWIRHTVRVDRRHADPVRRMQGEKILALLSYCLALAISRIGLAHATYGLVRFPLAMLPLLPLAWIVVLGIRRAQTLDELQRRIELIALAVVAIVAWLGAVTCWPLHSAGLPLLPLSLAIAALPVLYALVKRWARARFE